MTALDKLGIMFEGWRQQGHKYFHSFGRTGVDHWALGFQHFWLAAQKRGLTDLPFWDFSPETMAAEAGKCAPLALAYAFHIDASKYAGFMRKIAEQQGVERIEGMIEDVQLDATSGEITALRLDKQRLVEGDFFIDCTGFRALLIGQALGVGYEDWSSLLLCNSAIAVQSTPQGAPLPYTRSIAHAAGWQWRIPLRHRQGNGIVFSDAHMSRDAALEKLLSSLDGEAITDPNVIQFKPGVRRQQWHKNCVAIGLSSGFLEPLESTSIHLIHFNILRFLRLIPDGQVEPWAIDEFNRQVDEEMRSVKDFLILHYWQNARQKDDFWAACRDNQVPETLRHRVDLFRATGSFFRNLEELFSENSWIQVMMGQGVTPEKTHPVARQMSQAELSQMMQRLSAEVRRKVDALPAHGDFLAENFA